MAHSLILGGIRSGKSSLAERLVSEQSDPVVYVATATAGDGEMSERIRRHQRRRHLRHRITMRRQVVTRNSNTMLVVAHYFRPIS